MNDEIDKCIPLTFDEEFGGVPLIDAIKEIKIASSAGMKTGCDD
jgi:hypothetical protein